MFVNKVEIIVAEEQVQSVIETLHAKAPALSIIKNKGNYYIEASTSIPKNHLSNEPLVQLGNFPTKKLIRLCDNMALGEYVSQDTLELVRSYSKLAGSKVYVEFRNQGMSIITVELLSKYNIEMEVFEEVASKFGNVLVKLTTLTTKPGEGPTSAAEYLICGGEVKIVNSVSDVSDWKNNIDLATIVNLEFDIDHIENAINEFKSEESMEE